MPVAIVPAVPLTARQWESFVYQPFATGLAGDGAVTSSVLVTVTVASTGALSGSWTYDNGTAGVGATLTAPSAGVVTVDGRALTLGDTVLLKNEGTALRNGRYLMTTEGTVSVAAVFTRSVDSDTAGEMVGFVRALGGTSNVGQIYQWPSVLQVGVSAISFTAWTNRWRSSPLPAGATLNIATGRISADTLTEGGIYNIALAASDDSGGTWSPTMVFTLGVEPGPNDLHADVAITIDLQTRAVTVPGGTPSLKRGDDRLWRIRFVAGGVPLDLGTLTKLRLSLKEFDTEAAVETGGGLSTDSSPATIGKLGTGAQTQYLLWLRLDDPALAAALASNEADAGTSFTAQAEIEWEYPNATSVGPASLVATTRTFPVEIVRDQIL